MFSTRPHLLCRDDPRSSGNLWLSKTVNLGSGFRTFLLDRSNPDLGEPVDHSGWHCPPSFYRVFVIPIVSMVYNHNPALSPFVCGGLSCVSNSVLFSWFPLLSWKKSNCYRGVWLWNILLVHCRCLNNKASIMSKKKIVGYWDVVLFKCFPVLFRCYPVSSRPSVAVWAAIWASHVRIGGLESRDFVTASGACNQSGG